MLSQEDDARRPVDDLLKRLIREILHLMTKSDQSISPRQASTKWYFPQLHTVPHLSRAKGLFMRRRRRIRRGASGLRIGLSAREQAPFVAFLSLAVRPGALVASLFRS